MSFSPNTGLVRFSYSYILLINDNFYFAHRWRKIQQLGLSKEYRDKHSDTGKWLRQIFGLIFLNPQEVGDAFVFDFEYNRPHDTRVREFADYLVENYIQEDAVFPPEVWAENSASLSRTTNCCESFHSKLKNYCSSPHPNLHVFLNLLNDMQKDTYIKLNSIRINQKRNIRQEVLQKQKFIQEKINQYNDGNISRKHFIQCVSYKFSSFNM